MMASDVPAILIGQPILEIDWVSRPTREGPHWYRSMGGRYEMVFVISGAEYITKFSGAMLPISSLKGKFYGPILPTKYGV